jgi:lipopolysaccharide transport system ATP-binding protein
MSDPVIAVENLGKRYRIGHQQSHNYVALRDVLASKVDAPLRWFGQRAPAPTDRTVDFWALKDVSFEVQQGDVLGIIGRNGAGKSTLLKLLSRITEPTEGRVMLEGRVASLLEVGTGFHPELTGRENIFLNGAILGMTRSEIKRNFDEIVAFADVETFLDTPIKRYSSGMYVRLAFAIAAHLESEILIVDEVLAVGDVQFQKKCLRRMTEVAAGGRTVLVVSHNMNAVESLCTSALHLDAGRVQGFGDDVRGLIASHVGTLLGESSTSAWTNKSNILNHAVMQPLYFAVESSHGQPLIAPVRNDDPLAVVIRANVRRPDPSLKIGFSLFNESSQLLLLSMTTDGPEESWPRLSTGEIELQCALPKRFLNEGTYRLELHCSLHCREWIAQPERNSPAIQFTIRGGLSDSPYWLDGPRPGLLAPEWKWERSK